MLIHTLPPPSHLSAALRFQAPLIVLGAVAPLFCLLDNMTIKHVAVSLHYMSVGGLLGSYGVIVLLALGFVIKQTEQMTNKTDDTVKALKNMKLLKSQASSQAFQNLALCLLFAFWPFLQVRASWNISIAWPLVVHCLIVPLITKAFWPKRSRKVAHDSSLNSTAAHTSDKDDDGPAGDEEIRTALRLPV